MAGQSPVLARDVESEPHKSKKSQCECPGNIPPNTHYSKITQHARQWNTVMEISLVKRAGRNLTVHSKKVHTRVMLLTFRFGDMLPEEIN